MTRTTYFNTLPIVIDGPGIYLTRDGRRARIHEVKEYQPREGEPPRHEVTAFEAKGSAQMLFQGNLVYRGYDCWHVCGRRFPLKESPLDIIEKVEGL